MRKVVRCILKRLEKKKGLFVSLATVKNITGCNLNGNGSVQIVVLELLLGVEQLWNLQNYHFINGTCVWLT
jgi:hypothetical protein